MQSRGSLRLIPNKKQANLDERTARSVKVVAGACNHREFTLPPVSI